MIDWTWLVMAGALVGTILNIYKKKEGFILWAVTNAIWAVVDFNATLYAQSFQFIIYCGLAIWGYFSWRKK